MWLDRVNIHIEKFLNNIERDNNSPRHMTRHYFTRNQIAKVRVKNLRKKLKETLIKLKEKDNLDLLAEDSLDV